MSVEQKYSLFFYQHDQLTSRPTAHGHEPPAAPGPALGELVHAGVEGIRGLTSNNSLSLSLALVTTLTHNKPEKRLGSDAE